MRHGSSACGFWLQACRIFVVLRSLTTTRAAFTASTDPVGWEFAGPTTYISRFGDEPKLPSAAAVQSAVRGNNNTWFIGSVNGGVWQTQNLTAPHWRNVLDGQPDVRCASISALHYYPKGNILYAGCGGSTSSEQGADWNVVNSGDWGGVMVSRDNGDTWDMLNGFPVNYYVTDILQLSSEIILVAAQSHLYDRNKGGIWQSRNAGRTFQRVHIVPTFTLTKWDHHPSSSTIVLATHARTAKHSVSISMNQGSSFRSLQPPLPWTVGAVPFYTCAATVKDGKVVVAGLIRLPGGLPNNTDSQIFVTDIDRLVVSENERRNGSDNPSLWTLLKQPQSMDEDAMPKDRMALLGDPTIPNLLYIAGNAGALAWRVNLTSGIWTKMWGKADVVDGSVPHGDCRNYAWDKQTNRLVLVTDGGIFARINPRNPGGRWISLNGDYSALELLSAHYDPQGDRYVMGAQDNCAIVTKANATPGDVAFGFVEGDGAITLVDSQATPSRLFGTTQFLGVGTVYRDPETGKKVKSSSDDDDDDDDDDGCGGLCFVQGDRFIQVPLTKYFPEPSSFPYFVHPYTLNRQDPTLLHFWTNGTGPERPSAFYQFRIPYSVQAAEDIGPPTKIVESPNNGEIILDFVSGGFTAGQPDPDLILALSSRSLYRRVGSSWLEFALPVKFADPVTLAYDASGARILGPLTHSRTVQMAVSPQDSRIIAVTGWQSIDNNAGDEAIFVTIDAGKSWTNITGNLHSAIGVAGLIRPGGMVWIDLDNNDIDNFALLVGTSNGVAFCKMDVSCGNQIMSPFHWRRFGSIDEFPNVLVADVDYETEQDMIVAATFGRGIFVAKNAKQKLRTASIDLVATKDMVE